MDAPQIATTLRSSTSQSPHHYISSQSTRHVWASGARALFFIGLSFTLCGCPDDITALDVGVPTIDQDVTNAPDRNIGEDGSCLDDEECGRDQYCQLSERSIEGECTLGCRLEPDSCQSPQSRKICEAETRTCVLSCEVDSDCYDDHYCAAGICRPGCRVATSEQSSTCAPIDGTPQLCDPESRACIAGGVCCDLDDTCTVETAPACERVGGEILLGVISCEPNPCQAECVRDARCAPGEYCANYGRCAPGCRVDDPEGCPTDLTCDPELRACVNRICDEDATCPSWQYCNVEGRCRDGCREGECPEGFRCDRDHVCRVYCLNDGECGEDAYCEQPSERCRPICDPQTHLGCEPSEMCVAGRCEVGCADDPYEILGDDLSESAYELEWVSGGEGERRSSGIQERVLCTGSSQLEEDWIQLTLADGERLEVSLHTRPSSGPIGLSLIDEQGETLLNSDPWTEHQTLRYPELGRGVNAGVYWLKVSDLGLIEPHEYALGVRVLTEPTGCFSDANDPIDDTVNGARLIGLTPTLRFTEEASGDLCSGDRDYFCFPMSPSDGLDLYVETPQACDPLSVSLGPSSIFQLGPQQFEGYRLNELERRPDEPRTYLIELDPETGAFSNDEWCAQLTSSGHCEGYYFNATFARRQVVCSDQREPNNTVAQATELDGIGPLGDGTGVIPENITQTLNENMVLCQDDLDLFSVQSSAGNAWRAWLIDDSDPEDDPLRGRGQLVGELRVRFLNSDGVPVGDSAPVNPPTLTDGESIQFATAVSAVDERLYIEVSGIDDSAGPYQLKLLRIPSDGACSQDVNEPDGGDDELDPVSQLREESSGRLTVNNGYLCDEIDMIDEDWFTFEVAESNTRLCLNSTFRHRDGDINIELFEAGNLNQGDLCGSHAECRMNQMGSSCINRRCRAPVARGNSLDDGELIHFSSLETQAGRYYARVFSPEPTENAYQLAVTLVPPSETCDPDVHEGHSGNNRPQEATRFGSGRVELCDSWLCANERVEGDWYEIIVPAAAQRTIHVAFETQQGRLTLSAEDAGAIDGQVIESPRSQSRNVHCINVAAGPRPATVRIHVGGDVFNMNQSRIDYLLRVVPTNLNSSPRGGCDLLSGGLFSDVSWPLLNLGQ